MERVNSWGGAVVHELASPLYKGGKEEEPTIIDMNRCNARFINLFL